MTQDPRKQDPKKIADDLPPESDAADEEADALEDAPLDLLADALPDEGSEESLLRGAEAIRRCLRDAPAGPGVYRMLSESGEVLYVGKARSVRKRIASYVRPHGLSTRIARMVSATASMIFVSTRTETEALLLEANYIKQMKPRFNVLMRDDKSFPYIFLGGELHAPQLTKHRGARKRSGDYFGPFASVWAVDRTLAALQRAFLLRSCSDSYYENRTRPCLLWQIKRCSGPCTGEISLSDYASLVDEARDFLSGKSRAVRDRLALEMTEAADKLEFEKAARLRDRISALSAIQGQQGINPRSVEEADVFAVAEDAGQFCIEAFFFRAYQNWGNKAYFPRADRNFSAQEVLDAFLAQFYSDKPAPALVLLSHDIENRAVLEDALSERAGKRVAVLRPQRGEKKELVAQAAENALRALSQKLAQAASQHLLLESLATVFGLPGPLRRVEVYDNSHIMGAHAVGAMIVAGPAGFMKAHYRTFNFRDETISPGDDYGMMREVLRRRLRRLVKSADGPEQPAADEFPARPDLILIDGGRGQFEVAKSVFQELGIEGVALASIAKGADRDAGRETFFLEGREPFRLPPRDPALYFVQRLRDEAHRFAIGAHRARRKKQIVRNPLDEIDGIGPARKRALLNAFGSAKAVAGAGLADLEKTPGINAATAKLVYDFFHDRTG